MKKVAGNRKNKKLKNGEWSMKMIFEAPATVWQEAFPLGNGRIGALMFGDGEAETLCLNEDTLWSGYPGDPRTGMGYEDIKKAEVYAKEGSYLQATQVLNQAQEMAEDVEMYEPFGTVRIRFEGEREIADYHRELDLETATARVTYRNHGQSYEHRCFCSAPSQVLVYQIRAEEAFTIVVTADDGFLTGNSWDGKIWKMQGQMPGKVRFLWERKKGTAASLFFRKIRRKKECRTKVGACLRRKTGRLFRQRWEFAVSTFVKLLCGY